MNEAPKAGFNIVHIDHVVIRVHALGPMLDFYTGLLGCTLEREKPEVGLYQLRAGGSLIDLVPVDSRLGRAGGAGPGAEGRNMDHLCLRIEPFDGDALLDWLRGRGLDPGRVESRYGAEGDGPSIYITDPEGNVVELKGPPWDADP
jgi:catechol 2,3-dioxygenase-like lactoylglutathione lyase family enzyme